LLSETDNGYHLRIHNNTNYIFFGDIDNLNLSFDEWARDLLLFLENRYGISITIENISYTSNESKRGSYHYSVPLLFTSCEKLKEIHNNFNEEYKEKYFVESNGKRKKCIDLSIYSEHWFRLPNQSKEDNKNAIHTIIKGNMIDFIVSHIPENSLDITQKIINIKKNNNATKIESQYKLENIKPNNQKIYNHNNHKFVLYKKFFDECYQQGRFDDYEDWIGIGMALKNNYGNSGFELFDYFSSKGTNYEGTVKTMKKYTSFKENDEKSKSIGIIYEFAKQDNKKKYIKILRDDEFTFTETYFCEKILELVGDNFIYIESGENNYKLYCYNGYYWKNDDTLLKKYISTEFFDYNKEFIDTVYKKHNSYKKLKAQLNSLKKLYYKKILVETYKEYGKKVINFDTKWWLLGFENCVYDLKEGVMRNYQKTDYISVTTGYDWVEPTLEEIDKINNIIIKIMPDKDIRNLYKQILCTSLEGRALEKFIIFNGYGRNGKGLIDDLLLLALGNHGINANNSLLFEKSRTGSNPEKANLHKKRLVIFKEPPAKNKFENSMIKELTGGGKFSARTHNEKETEKLLFGTMICECNKKPLFAEEPTNAEIDRLIDLHFGSTFTSEKENINEEEHVYEAVKEYKELPFQHKHKYALLKILMESYKEYQLNNYNFIIPKIIKERTIEYLESNCQLLEWFKEKYELVEGNDKNIFISIKSIYDAFKTDAYYDNLTKYEKRKMNYKYFLNYFSQNIITKKQFKARYVICNNNMKTEYTNVLLKYNDKIAGIGTSSNNNFVQQNHENPLDFGIDTKQNLSLSFD
jgi:phage/plasmid-associated DNA primase